MDLDELSERYKLQKSLANSYNSILKLFIDNPELLEKLKTKYFIEKILDNESITSIFSQETNYEKADKLIETILLSKLETMKEFIEFYEQYQVISEKKGLNEVVKIRTEKREEVSKSKESDQQILYYANISKSLNVNRLEEDKNEYTNPLSHSKNVKYDYSTVKNPKGKDSSNFIN
jgi:hypothetical protein